MLDYILDNYLFDSSYDPAHEKLSCIIYKIVHF